ncbi:MAG: 3-deoxy-7-phosphoheptulonate synthase, partial [Spirochaetaceae bacterium]|nr:3-deoxy-7-phosphoheptulonate synthase [Spirochaetaceae bacterium]
MEFERKLTIPMKVKEMYPLSDDMPKIIGQKRAELCSLFEGKDDRLLLVIGPCSADNEDSVL